MGKRRDKRGEDWDMFRNGSPHGKASHGGTASHGGASAVQTRHMAELKREGATLQITFKTLPFDPLKQRVYFYPCASESSYKSDEKVPIDASNKLDIVCAAGAFGLTGSDSVKQLRVDLGLLTRNGLRVTLGDDVVPIRKRPSEIHIFSSSPLTSAGMMGGRSARSGGGGGDKDK
jgi:hypothetical protein